MKKWNPNDTTIQGGPGGYVRVTLPGFGDCYAQLNACACKPYLWDVWASVYGWHRGDNKVFWSELSPEAKEALWTTLDDETKAEAIRVLGRDPYPAGGVLTAASENRVCRARRAGVTSLYKCCADSCPGYPYRASEIRHPCR